MKKFLLLTSLLLSVFFLSAQYRIPQTLGSDSTLVTSKGGLKGRMILWPYSDTASANLEPISKYPGALIRIDNTAYLRDTTATKWINLGTASDIPDSILSTIANKVDSIAFASSDNVDTVKYLAGGQWYIVGYIDRPDGLISPGYVSWSGTGLTFDVTAAIYRIGGHRYTSSAGSITLAAADPSLPRIDVIAVDTTGSIVNITGIPDANPATPQVDLNSQVYLTSVYISAGATVPSGITTELIYDENIEWTTSTSSSNVDFNDTGLPFHGSTDIKVVNSAALLDFTNTSLIKIADYSVLKLYVNTPTPASGQIVLKFYKNGQSVGIINVTSAYGFNNVSGYQNITIPLSSVIFRGSSFNKVEISYTSPSTSTAYFDYIQLQGGISNQGNSNAITNVFKKEGTDSVFYTSNGIPVFAFRDSSYNQPLLTNKSVPYVGTDGLLHEDNLGLYWDGYNLVAGGNGYSNTTGILLNGGRGSVQASGAGITIKTTGSLDTAKHIALYNSDRKYLDMSMASDSSLNMETSVNIYPDTANTYNLGALSAQWDTLFTKKLYLNGVEFNPIAGSGISQVVAGWGLENVDDSTLRADSVQFKAVFYNKNSVDSALATKAPLLHTHDATDITSGIINTARLGTGVANSTKVLAGDGTWKTNTGSDSVYINLALASDSSQLYARRINGNIDTLPLLQKDTLYKKYPLVQDGDTTKLRVDSMPNMIITADTSGIPGNGVPTLDMVNARMGGGSTDTSHLSDRIDLKLNISDTASMLSPYVRGVIPGTNTSIDNTNPQYPVISSTGGGSITSYDSTITATSSQTDFIFSSFPSSASYISVFINSCAIDNSYYTYDAATQTLTFTSGTVDGDKIRLHIIE